MHIDLLTLAHWSWPDHAISLRECRKNTEDRWICLAVVWPRSHPAAHGATFSIPD